MSDIAVRKLSDTIITLMIYDKLKVVIWSIWVCYNAIWFLVIADLKFVRLNFVDLKFIRLKFIDLKFARLKSADLKSARFDLIIEKSI